MANEPEPMRIEEPNIQYLPDELDVDVWRRAIKFHALQKLRSAMPIFISQTTHHVSHSMALTP